MSEPAPAALGLKVERIRAVLSGCAPSRVVVSKGFASLLDGAEILENAGKAECFAVIANSEASGLRAVRHSVQDVCSVWRERIAGPAASTNGRARRSARAVAWTGKRMAFLEVWTPRCARSDAPYHGIDEMSPGSPFKNCSGALERRRKCTFWPDFGGHRPPLQPNLEFLNGLLAGVTRESQFAQTIALPVLAPHPGPLNERRRADLL